MAARSHDGMSRGNLVVSRSFCLCGVQCHYNNHACIVKSFASKNVTGNIINFEEREYLILKIKN